MTWEMIHCHFPLSPEDIEHMEVMRDLLKRLEEKPEKFLLLLQPKLNYHFSWFNEALFDKIYKLVKKEATKEIASLEAQLQQQEQEEAKR